jgi:hypothetical protein
MAGKETLGPVTGFIRTVRVVHGNRSSKMKATKTLTLAALAALSLGIGTAMAQDGGQAYPDWQGRRDMNAARQSYVPGTPYNGQPQSGSSDVNTMDSGADHSATFILQNHLYGAGGVGG